MDHAGERYALESLGVGRASQNRRHHQSIQKITSRLTIPQTTIAFTTRADTALLLWLKSLRRMWCQSPRRAT
jgi:hypothetical protein